ncbi:MAG TPA: ROK family protein [Terriglobales bacterium]|jgi:glucokinase|nr:ROK family protein [Terriglobales bacterium]
MNECIVGIDIGGTKIAAGIVDLEGTVLAGSRSGMAARGSAAEGLAAVESAIESVLAKKAPSYKVRGIGICSPGPLDPLTGVVINPPNLPCWRNFPLAASIRASHRVPVMVENDANAAALAECKWGAGRGYRNVFYLCLGTGIGTGVVLDGVIYHGRTGSAGEGGHMGIDRNGPLCGCGKRGCIEALASGPAIARRARENLEREKLAKSPSSRLLELADGEPERITSQMVGEACAEGDPVARAVIGETLDVLAYWLGNIIDLIEPEVIVMGGGVASMLAPYLDDLRGRWKGAVVNPWPDKIPVVLARYGEEAGVAGAAALLTSPQSTDVAQPA